jgi:hypothetical protein
MAAQAILFGLLGWLASQRRNHPKQAQDNNETNPKKYTRKNDRMNML